jgi:hypothetical protein
MNLLKASLHKNSHIMESKPATAMDGGSAENAGAVFPPQK